MNIFKEYVGFIGGVDIDKLIADTQEFWRLAQELRSRLGDRAYLLDTYLSLVFEGLNATAAYDAALEGFEGNTLRGLCQDILLGEESERAKSNPLYERAKTYIAERPLPFRQHHTKVSFYHAALIDEFMGDLLADFLKEKQQDYIAVFDIVRLQNLYSELVELLGKSDSIESLNSMICCKFRIASAAAVFLQGVRNDQLHSLLFRDEQSNKQVFQLLLEDKPGRKREPFSQFRDW